MPDQNSPRVPALAGLSGQSIPPEPAPAANVTAGSPSGRLPHRSVDHVPIVPLGLALQVLEHAPVLLVHVRAVGVLAIGLFALEYDAEPDLVGVLGAAEGRVIKPARGRISLERSHLLHELLLVAGLDQVSRDRAKHHVSPPPLRS